MRQPLLDSKSTGQHKATLLLSFFTFLLLSLLFLHSRGAYIREVRTGSDEEESPRPQGLRGAVSDDSMLWQLQLQEDFQEIEKQKSKSQSSSRSSLASGSTSRSHTPQSQGRPSPSRPVPSSPASRRPPPPISIPIPQTRAASDGDLRRGTGSADNSPTALVAGPSSAAQASSASSSSIRRTQSSASVSGFLGSAGLSSSPHTGDFPSMLSQDSLPIIDEKSTQDLSGLVNEPQGYDFPPGTVSPWGVVSQFREPIAGEKNLFVYWGGSEPGPLVGSFMNAIIRNRGSFDIFIITDANKELYMTQVVDGKQIAPNHETREPSDTWISWEVYDRILTPGRLPIATQHDFIVNTMVALYGGAYMDPGLLGPGKLDYWWQVMIDNDATYLNYADGSKRDATIQRHTRVEIDKEGIGKWGGDMWLDTFFTMATVNSGIMKCFLHLTANNPNWGPLPSQINRSLYFIYGGDVFDSCFASVYEKDMHTQIADLPQGVYLYPGRRQLALNIQRAHSLGRLGGGEGPSVPRRTPQGSPARSRSQRGSPQGSPGRSRSQRGSPQGSPGRSRGRPPSKRRELVVSEAYRNELLEEINELLIRMAYHETVSNDQMTDPPSIYGVPLPFDFSGKAILLDQYEGDDIIGSNVVPRARYDELVQPMKADFDLLLEQGDTTAVMVQKAINLLVTPDGGIYLKFYGTGTPSNPLRLMQWEQLCGPPMTFIMYLQSQVTGWNVCTGSEVEIARPKPIPRSATPLILRAPPPPAPGTASGSSTSGKHSTPPSPILKPSSSESSDRGSPSKGMRKRSVSFDAGTSALEELSILPPPAQAAAGPSSLPEAGRPGSSSPASDEVRAPGGSAPQLVPGGLQLPKTRSNSPEKEPPEKTF